jgi:hypothetical protein
MIFSIAKLKNMLKKHDGWWGRDHAGRVSAAAIERETGEKGEGRVREKCEVKATERSSQHGVI